MRREIELFNYLGVFSTVGELNRETLQSESYLPFKFFSQKLRYKNNKIQNVKILYLIRCRFQFLYTSARAEISFFLPSSGIYFYFRGIKILFVHYLFTFDVESIVRSRKRSPCVDIFAFKYATRPGLRRGKNCCPVTAKVYKRSHTKDLIVLFVTQVLLQVTH